jgi:Zn-dependent M28 family amino/carboxypeptidase
MKQRVADAIFAAQEQSPPGVGHPGTETTKGFALKDVSLTMSGSFTEETIPTWNVVGLVEGADPALRNQYVAVTAHLDGTAPRTDGEINNSADDNASGCAGLIEICKAVVADPPRRSVLFVLFSGEEAACIGSRHFVSDCPVPIDKIVANVNMDMIGRTDEASMADRSHYAIDSDKVTPEFTKLIKDVNERTLGWPLKYTSVTGTSDNLMFHAVNIAAVSFYSGHHGDANKPTDDPEKLDYEKAEKIAQLVYEVVMELGNRDRLW